MQQKVLLRKVGTIIAKTVAKKSHKKDDRRRQNLKKKKKKYIYIAKNVSVSCLHFRRQGQLVTKMQSDTEVNRWPYIFLI